MNIFGLSAVDFETLNELVIHPLKDAKFKVYLFGSRARGTHHPFSDIDLLICPNGELDRGKISQVREDIEEARFPVKVELVVDSELAQSYRPNVEKEKIEI